MFFEQKVIFRSIVSIEAAVMLLHILLEISMFTRGRSSLGTVPGRNRL